MWPARNIMTLFDKLAIAHGTKNIYNKNISIQGRK